MIFGMDDDDLDVFHKTVNFLIKEKVAYAEFFILTPMPGTELRKRFEGEGRVTDYNWSHYDGFHTVYRPLKMGKEDLEKGLWGAYKEFYSIPSIIKRCVWVKNQNRRIRTILSNFYYRKMVLKNRHPLYGE
jgi:radical SAM superfamily enzyme YgiQ (UPF0313 family)